MNTDEENDRLSDDEWRLIKMWRCLDKQGRYYTLLDIGEKAMVRCLPHQSLYNFMPGLVGEVGQEEESILENTSSQSYLIYHAMETSGDSHDDLLGTSDYDEEGMIACFAREAQEIATQQGSLFDYNEDFVREYIRAWRWEIVYACMRASRDIESRDSLGDQDRIT